MGSSADAKVTFREIVRWTIRTVQATLEPKLDVPLFVMIAQKGGHSFLCPRLASARCLLRELRALGLSLRGDGMLRSLIGATGLTRRR